MLSWYAAGLSLNGGEPTAPPATCRLLLRSAATISSHREVARGRALGIDPHAHRVVARRVGVHVADALRAQQPLAHLQARVVRDVLAVDAAVGREHVHDQQDVRRALAHRDAEIAHRPAAAAAERDWMRFCTSTCAMSMLVPFLNVTVIDMRPSLVDDEDM